MTQLTKGRRITGDERGTLSDELRQQYESGRSIRSIAAETGQVVRVRAPCPAGVRCDPSWSWWRDPREGLARGRRSQSA